jgi:N-acetylglucosaminyl-diphospho-decaprenol L-rhamnosyltransferase
MIADVATVIVAHNSVGCLPRCLESVAAAASSVDARVLVADSGSSDGVEALCKRLDVPFLPGPNRGLAAAFNRALDHRDIRRARYVLQLNPDIVLAAGALDALVELADRRPRCGILAPRHVDEHGERIHTIGVEPNVTRYWRAVADPFSHDWVWESEGHEYEREADWVVGACMLLRGEMLATIGGFDERFFLSSEDVDLCRRCRAAGWSVIYAPTVTVVHPIADRPTDEHRLRLDEWSRILYLRKWHRWPARMSMRVALVARLARLAAIDARRDGRGNARLKLAATLRFDSRRYGAEPPAPSP